MYKTTTSKVTDINSATVSDIRSIYHKKRQEISCLYLSVKNLDHFINYSKLYSFLRIDKPVNFSFVNFF